ncbi:hypothetical protein DOY81_006551 [Sarcophaga bullata]|nr:hypothetical protein DOY81_006551 [Sarcophaga bullata]
MENEKQILFGGGKGQVEVGGRVGVTKPLDKVIVASLLLQFAQPNQDFLIGQTVQRTSQTVHTGSKGEVGIAQGRANQVHGVGRYIATFVITVDGQVETHQFGEFGIVIAQHLNEIGRPIQIGINGFGAFAIAVVSLSEFTVMIQGSNGSRELGHWVQGGGEIVQHALVGTSPVINNQKRPSGNGSEPPSAAGNTFWHSGMERPRKRIPSSASKTEVSVTKALMPRIPPYI